MADRIQKQKPEESNSDRILREMDEQLAQGPVTFEGQTGRQSLSQASSQANSTIGNIDSALAENDAAMPGRVPVFNHLVLSQIEKMSTPLGLLEWRMTVKVELASGSRAQQAA